MRSRLPTRRAEVGRPDVCEITIGTTVGVTANQDLFGHGSSVVVAR